MNELSSILSLDDTARLEASEHAKAYILRLIGNAPSKEQFEQATIQPYPTWLIRVVALLSLVALIASFTLSAMALFEMASKTYSTPYSQNLVIAGIAVIILAELSQVLFSIAVAVLPSSKATKGILYTGMAISTAIALVGNVQHGLANTNMWLNPFAWLLAIAPPLLVLGIGYTLKEQLLGVVAQRHTAQRLHAEAIEQWRDLTAFPERHVQYKQALANALRKALVSLNSKGTGATQRKELMQSFDGTVWKMLVNRELAQDTWYQDATTQNYTIVDIATAKNEVAEAVGSFLELTTHHTNGNHNGNGNGHKPSTN